MKADKKPRLQRFKYVLGDALSAWAAYTGLFIYRKEIIEQNAGHFSIEQVLSVLDERYRTGSVWVILFWIALSWLTGFYAEVYRRSRIRDLINTFALSIAGSVILFFALILDDFVEDFRDYYALFGLYLGLQFGLTAAVRTIVTTFSAIRIKNREIGFPTLIVGSNQIAVELFNELESARKSAGFQFVGFASVNNNLKYLLGRNLPHLGEYTELETILREQGIEEVIIAIESREHDKLQAILSVLKVFPGIRIHMVPDTYDLISGQVRLESYGAPLIVIRHELMPLWQKVIKRALDVVLSLIGLLVLSPFFLFGALMVKLSSPGPIFYRQERVGMNGKTFKMIKFRSMFSNAESNGPQLSSENDPRITPWGRVMRRHRLDELPQLFNVLWGEMSLVGPRPERKYYIERIVEKAPHYRHLLKVKPGLTSWGMVKFGYAENVEEMVERLKYDIIYIENINIMNDLKILIYTVLIVFQGRGK